MLLVGDPPERQSAAESSAGDGAVGPCGSGVKPTLTLAGLAVKPPLPCVRAMLAVRPMQPRARWCAIGIAATDVVLDRLHVIALGAGDAYQLNLRANCAGAPLIRTRAPGRPPEISRVLSVGHGQTYPGVRDEVDSWRAIRSGRVPDFPSAIGQIPILNWFAASSPATIASRLRNERANHLSVGRNSQCNQLARTGETSRRAPSCRAPLPGWSTQTA